MKCVPDMPAPDGLAGLNLGRAQARASGVTARCTPTAAR